MPCLVDFPPPRRVKAPALQSRWSLPLCTGVAIPDWGPRRAVSLSSLWPRVPPAASPFRPGAGRAARKHRLTSASVETLAVRLSRSSSFFRVKEKQLKWSRPKYESNHESVQDGVVFTSQSPLWQVKSANPAAPSVTAMRHQDHVLSWMQELPQL